MTRTILLLAAAWPTVLAAQPPAPPPAPPPSEEGDEEAIVVVGQRDTRSVVGDIPPENVLDTRDIRATGASSIAELLQAVESQTGSARGRGAGRPVLLLNGQRISGFRELRDLPPEAIERMEILPEEVALKYGYSADQRVVNIVLRRRFDSTSAELRGTVATDGDYAGGLADATKLILRDGRRISLNARIEGNDPLYEADRDIARDPASALDERGARTLVGAAQSARLTGTYNRPLGTTGSASVTAEAAIDRGRSRFGLADFDPSDVLTRDSTTTSLGLGTIANWQRGEWRLSAGANGDYEHGRSGAERSEVLYLTNDKSRSTRTSVAADATANGPLATLPAGALTATLKAGLSRLDLDSSARRRDLVSDVSLGRTIGEASINLDLPLAKRDSAIGRLSLNANGGLRNFSDFGTLSTIGGGLTWSPTPRLNVIASWTREEGAPSLQELGNPLIETAGVPYFDAVRGETVEVTTLTGGNPALDADRRTVWKLGANWRVKDEPDLRLRAEFVSQTIDRPQIGFPAATPALEAAFPGRFVRVGGVLSAVDLRPVNGEQARRDTIRWGVDFTKRLRTARPSRDQIQALIGRFLGQRGGQGGGQSGGQPPAVPAAPGSAGPGGTPGAGGPPGGGFGGFGGGGGRGAWSGGRGGRLTFTLGHTLTLKDKLAIAPGLTPLDYLGGDAFGAFGGRPRHVVEVETGWYNNGLGARLTANWQSATRLDSALGPDIRFGDRATLDLRLFANLGERIDLVAKNPFFIGSSVRFEIRNLLNERPVARAGDGPTPFAYQADRLEPVGRTVSLSFRKLFVPRRFFQQMRGTGAQPPR